MGGEGTATTIPDNFPVENASTVSANGRSFTANMYVVDGLDITSSVMPGVVNLSPNPDSIDEISIETNTFTVEYGRAGSILTEITTKSGTNQFHGRLADYYTSQPLWARTEFTTKYLPFTRNDYTASIGGPIIKNHTFFFGSVEALHSNTETSSGTSFEAPQFVQWAAQNFPATLGTKLLTQYPVTKASITGVTETAMDVFPSSCGTPATANIPCDLPMVDSGVDTFSPYRNGTQWNVRLDQYWTKDRLYGNYYQTIYDDLLPSIRTGMDSSDHLISKSFQLNETHTFSSTLLNEASAGYLRAQGREGLGGPHHVPWVNVTGQDTGFGVGGTYDYIQHNFHWRDVVSLTRGTHSLKFGFEGFEGDEESFFAGVYDIPTFQFTNLLNLMQDNPYSETGFAYNALTGQPGAENFGRASTRWAGFVQDEWKARPNLTVTMGFREDDYGKAHASKRIGSIFSNFFLGAGSTFAQQIANGSLRQVFDPLNHALIGYSPRVGVAWDPTRKGTWKIRAGIGVYHDWVTTAQQTDRMRANPPLFMIPTFLTGTTIPPIFSVGTNDNYPFGFTVPTLAPQPLDSRGGVPGTQLNVGAIDPNMGEPVTYNYTIGLERKLGANFVASASFSGSRSTGLLVGDEVDQSPSTDVNRFAGDEIVNNGVLKRLNPSFGAINYTWNGNTSTYRALILSVVGRLGARSSLQVSYTRSSTYDYGERYPDVTNIGQYWGPANFSVPNRFSLTESYQLPTLGHANVLARRVLGGWNIGGTVILESGMPFTVYTGAPFEPIFDASGQVTGMAPGSGDYNADGNDYDFPNAPSSGYSHGTTTHDYLGGLFPASAFPVPPMGSEGNEKRGGFRGPGFANWDAGLIKDNRITEKVGLQLRFEFFNILNHPNLNGVDGNLADSSFGRTLAVFNPRYVQFAAKLEF
jgi:hypothetical protein